MFINRERFLEILDELEVPQVDPDVLLCLDGGKNCKVNNWHFDSDIKVWCCAIHTLKNQKENSDRRQEFRNI